jgi:prepilin-type N-terminal cleavage/methylation domain-containing protein
MKKINSKGFTLIELLIVIAIIAIIAGAIFVALNPLQRFQDSRDARRWSDAASLLGAIKVNQVDLKGINPWPIQIASSGIGLMISSATTTSGCNATACNTLATSTNACINLQPIVDSGYLGALPVSPNESGSWTTTLTGYVLTKSATGAIKIQACEVGNSANSPTISVTR